MQNVQKALSEAIGQFIRATVATWRTMEEDPLPLQIDSYQGNKNATILIFRRLYTIVHYTTENVIINCTHPAVTSPGE